MHHRITLATITALALGLTAARLPANDEPRLREEVRVVEKGRAYTVLDVPVGRIEPLETRTLGGKPLKSLGPPMHEVKVYSAPISTGGWSYIAAQARLAAIEGATESGAPKGQEFHAAHKTLIEFRISPSDELLQANYGQPILVAGPEAVATIRRIPEGTEVVGFSVYLRR